MGFFSNDDKIRKNPEAHSHHKAARKLLNRAEQLRARGDRGTAEDLTADANKHLRQRDAITRNG